MRSIRVPLELTVRLVRVVEGVENRRTSKPCVAFDRRMRIAFCGLLLIGTEHDWLLRLR
jgi:hypothetical protein